MSIAYRATGLFLCLVLLALGLCVGVESSGAQSFPQKAFISYSSSGINFMDLFLGKDKNFFREEGLEPQLIQMNATIAINAAISGQVDALASVGSAIRAIQRGAPLRVLAVTLLRPLFWLVARPEYRSVKDLKHKVLAISTIGGSQHTMAKRMLALGGLDADKDLTFIQIGDQTLQLQALTSNSVQVTALSPPWVFLARDKFKMNVLDNTDKFPSFGSGFAVPIKLLQEKPELVKKLLRARAKGNRYFLENEREASELLARLYRVDVKTALESYRFSKSAFAQTGIPTDEEIKEHLAVDAQLLKLPEAVPPSQIFDFSLQREVNRELGIK